MTEKQQVRKVSALARLQAQLKSGVKTRTFRSSSHFKWDIQNKLEEKGYSRDVKHRWIDGVVHFKLPLTESNVNRINKEISILKSKL